MVISKSLWYNLNLFLLKLYLKIKGVRFYETDSAPTCDAYRSLTVLTVDNKTIEFYFHIENLTDYHYSYKGMTRKKHKFYLIRAKFDEGFNDTLKKFNNLKLFVSSKEFLFDDVDIVAAALTNIYLDFILASIKFENESKCNI